MTTSHTIIGFSIITVLALFGLMLVSPTADARGYDMYKETKDNDVDKARRHATSTATTTAAARTCVATAVKNREGVLANSWTEYSTSMQSALAKRTIGLVSAWNLEDGAARRTALMDTWKAWRSDRKAAHEELRKDRKIAWDGFRKTVKDTCRTTVPHEEGLEKSERDSVAI